MIKGQDDIVHGAELRISRRGKKPLFIKRSLQKKGFWKIRHIENLIKGQDDIVRGAELRISSRGKKPLQKETFLAEKRILEDQTDRKLD